MSVRTDQFIHVGVPPEKLERMKVVAKERKDKWSKRSYRVDPTRRDWSLNLDGVRAEWALATLTHGTWNPRNHRGNDGGLDVRFEAMHYGKRRLIGAQVKCLGRRLPAGGVTNLLLYVRDPKKDIERADHDVRIYVLSTLCVCNPLMTRDDECLGVDFIGWITREHFLAAGKWEDLGHGANWSVPQEELSPIARLQPWAHDPPPWPYER